METINLDVLTRPFTPEQIRQREGRGGTRLDYLETHSVITRLNEAFNGAWSFEVVSHEVTDNEVLVRGRLSAGGHVKEQFGGSDIARHRDSGKPVSIADDLKSAASDALKKCATLFGVGLHLYDKPQAARQPAQQRPAQQADRRPGQVQTRPQQPVSANGRPVQRDVSRVAPPGGSARPGTQDVSSAGAPPILKRGEAMEQRELTLANVITLTRSEICGLLAVGELMTRYDPRPDSELGNVGILIRHLAFCLESKLSMGLKWPEDDDDEGEDEGDEESEGDEGEEWPKN